MRLVSYVLLCFMFKQSSRACSFIKKNRLWHRCFPVNFAKLLKAPFRSEYLRWLLLCVEVKLFSNPYWKKYNNPQINFSDFVCHISFPNSGYLMFYIRPIRYSFFTELYAFLLTMKVKSYRYIGTCTMLRKPVRSQVFCEITVLKNFVKAAWK